MRIFPLKRGGRKKKTKFLSKLKAEVTKHPSSSCRSLAKLVRADHKTVQRRLHEDLEMKHVSVTKIPHALTPAQIEKRVEIAGEMEEFLRIQKEQGFRSIFTGDESWIKYDNSAKKMWVGKHVPSPEHDFPALGSKKILLTVFFNAEKVLHISFLPQGTSMNSARFTKEVLGSLHAALMSAPDAPPRPWFIHFDNARPHTSVETQIYLKGTNFIQVDTPPYSPDLSPSDFYLFGTLKASLRGEAYSTDRTLKAAVRKWLTNLSGVELYPVFRNWLERCEYVTDTGKYYIKGKTT
jgi:histone-lysine N-methyltransferase SETMAR